MADSEIIRLFENHLYTTWQNNRVDFSIKLFGKDYFKGKTLLELGCGLGHIGQKFEAIGSIVTYAEGKEDNFRLLCDRVGKEKCIHLNQENPWNLGKKFDIIIHWGVLYHLNNWQQDLKCATEHTNLLFFETMVSDSADVDYELKITEHPGMDQALNDGERGAIGTRPSPVGVERELTQLGFTYERYDKPSLNVENYHVYDWTPKNDNSYTEGQRRFWIAKRIMT